jgi:hypothetical protein
MNIFHWLTASALASFFLPPIFELIQAFFSKGHQFNYQHRRALPCLHSKLSRDY